MNTLLAFSVCLVAVTSGYRLPFIINGRDAEVGEFPWQASLQTFGEHYCGASLVTSKWLITAAHCVYSWCNRGMSIVLGAHDIKTQIEGKPTNYAIEKVITHEGVHGLDNDIALVKLKHPAAIDGEYIDTIRPAPAAVVDLVGANCTITGWGDTQTGGITSRPNVLQVAATTPMSKSECQDGLDRIPGLPSATITDDHICVAGQGAEGGCHGDSGGPLTCMLDDGSLVLAGETKGGDPKCHTIYPSIYTRISSFRQWLSDNSDGEISVDL